jgi:hypothetical protein
MPRLMPSGRLAPTAQVILVIDFAFEFLKRAFLVGAIQYGAAKLNSPLLGPLAFVAKIALALWAADKVWDGYDYFNQTDHYPPKSFHWWFRLGASSLCGIITVLFLFSVVTEIAGGLVRG